MALPCHREGSKSVRYARAASRPADRAWTHAEEAWAFNSNTFSWWLFDEQQVEHSDKLRKAERNRFDALMRAQYQSGTKRWFFEQARPFLNADAVRYIDNLLAQPG